MGLFDFLKKQDPNLTLPQNNREIWFRDTYAIWSQGNYEAFQHFCGLEKNSENASHCRYILGRDWETIGKDKLLNLFNSLSGANDDTATIINDFKVLKNSNDEQDKINYILFRNAIAWDLCRATQVLGMAYHGGWIDRETMNEKSAIAGRLMQKGYDSWEDLISCYLQGYRDWAREEFDHKTAEENIKIREQAYEIVKNHEKPAYTIDWNLKL